jgi:hypothetical protein
LHELIEHLSVFCKSAANENFALNHKPHINFKFEFNLFSLTYNWVPDPAKMNSTGSGSKFTENIEHLENSTVDDACSSTEYAQYDNVPRYANTMGTESASIPVSGVEHQTCNICFDNYFDKMFPPCCDRLGNTDCDTIPDLELCDHNVTCIKRLQFCIFFEFGKVSKLCTWYCTSYDRMFGWSKVADATIDFFKLCGNPDIFNVGCVASCVPYFAFCYLIYIPLWLPCYACFALSQSFRKARTLIKSRSCRFLVNAFYLLSAGIGLTFRELTKYICPGRTCFGSRKGCGPECAQVHRGGRYYTNFGQKNDGYEEYCLSCDQSWESHAGNFFVRVFFIHCCIL